MADFVSSSPEETIALGKRIASRLQPGSVIALRGGLGAGKTCLTRGIAQGLGIEETVTSPTYTIISEYEGTLPPAGTNVPGGKFPLYHIDAYRLAGEDDFINIGGEELINGAGISVIEWSERIPLSIPKDAFFIDIEITGDSKRMIHLSEGLL
ncbi:MAG: tRNA (adenosine(37)-N6)-threonylcarbamoyltransferase complex ATPase subunit type 1 TsaE [Treponema sp.]|nr:tRNA (adenosine(37)-N6)-threonylcarbamoyltransferase complex ATPase subunit type 1 TsaE [Treponema sp.]